MKIPKPLPIYNRIQDIIEFARIRAARSVNTAQVVSNWLIGREIVEEEQAGKAKAQYGAKLLMELSTRLKREYGNGYSVDNLELFRRFYREYPSLISDAPRRKLVPVGLNSTSFIESNKICKPGLLNSNLSWTHYRLLLRIDKKDVRAFYEIEAFTSNWAARELERQINSLLYERLALSRIAGR